ncbi:hypothetical protein FXF69_09805 [Actinomadura chibensis]|uniref:Uncharacterized protein n=1 Tax=Actinomadura chibensis TaxID=392828 RepID=A0A5D0NZ05_9ACTN|nr:hypothetical protein FXF69_09805 [Actinomadura chibensis]
MPPPHRRGANRRRYRTAVLGASAAGGIPDGAGRPLRVVTGIVLDASPHLLVLGAPGGGETRIAMGEATVVWHGGRAGHTALRPGRPVIVRLKAANGVGGTTGAEPPGGASAVEGVGRIGGVYGADRVWVGISRVTGTILACGRDSVDVDMGPHRGRTRVAIPPNALERVLVRHPRLEPGYLIDVICVASSDGPRAVRPGTSQPGYRADDLAAPEVTAPVPEVLRGTATWFGGADERAVDAPDATHGAAYPAVDPEGDAGGCADAPSGCVAFPYLSLGSEVVVHNECGGRAAAVPVVECGCTAARYCDRCVDCDATPRGRIVELTPAAFAGLGGELESGCFNAAVRPVGTAGRAVSW